MSNQVPVLKSQLSPPPVKDQFIHRIKLHRQLQLIPNYPLTIIYAGAGYGKTVGLSRFIQDLDSKSCWLTVAEYDQHIIRLLTKMVTAIQSASPEFGRDLMDQFNQLNQHVKDDELWTLMTMMVNEIEALNDELVLVIDDVHVLNQAHSFHKWMQLLIKHIPKTFTSSYRLGINLTGHHYNN
ncbi:AAA family ATPase [Piscibacillus salipiscarius]|uniref:AAA family ATPase n=1 Tax=Piscibacillus salipiscarius TaxID=299480 RepID=UPI0006D1EB35|nr:AAA family ATPase [Piscibacillus salipiscarius]